MQDKDKDKPGTEAEADEAKPVDGDDTPSADDGEEAGDGDAPWGPKEGNDTPAGDGDDGIVEPESALDETETPGDEPEGEVGTKPERRSSPLVGMVGIVLLALMAAVVGSAIGPHLLGTGAGLSGSTELQLQNLETETAKISGLADRVSKLETEVSGSSSGAAVTTEIKDLTDRIAKLESDSSSITTSAAPDLSDLEAKISKLQSDIAALSTSSGTSSSSGDDGTLAATVASLSQQADQTAQALSELKSQLANLDKLSGEVTSLSSQVDELAGRSVDPKAAFVVAVGQLRDAANGSDPFDQALGAVASVAPSDSVVAADLATLKPLASTGVPTLANLQSSFSATADAVVIAERGGDNWVDQTLSSLEGLVSIRRVGGDVEGDTAEAVVARAEAALNDGKLDQAVTDVASLTGAPAEAAATWLAQAKDRLTVDKAVTSLSTTASDLVTGAAGSGS